MKNLMFLFVGILMCVRSYTQNLHSGGIEYNSEGSMLSIICSDIEILPDSIISLHFETLRIEKCYELNYTVLFRQLSKHEELKCLHLNDCNITHLNNGVSLIPNLKELILDYNNLESFSEGFPKLKLETLSLFRNRIGHLSYSKQFELYSSISKQITSTGFNLNISSNGIDSLPNCFNDLQLKSLDISDNKFNSFPDILVSMINDKNLKVLIIDNFRSFFNTYNILYSVQNKYNRNYVTVLFACFIDDFCFTESEINYLNNTFIAIHFSSMCKRSFRKYK